VEKKGTISHDTVLGGSQKPLKEKKKKKKRTEIWQKDKNKGIQQEGEKKTILSSSRNGVNKALTICWKKEKKRSNRGWGEGKKLVYGEGPVETKGKLSNPAEVG